MDGVYVIDTARGRLIDTLKAPALSARGAHGSLRSPFVNEVANGEWNEP